ncbi:MAG: hypothetical protein MJB14_18930 [Spirochaetes bacterium]|nr:hypothetical protein [Spirochaetota bacterium]
MQIGIVFIGVNNRLKKYKAIFKEELIKKGHQVDEVDSKNNPRIGRFKYLLFFVDSSGMFKKKFEEDYLGFFKEAGPSSARYACFFMQNTFLPNKTLRRLMHQLEKQGLMVHQGDILTSEYQAKTLATELEPIEPGQ